MVRLKGVSLSVLLLLAVSTPLFAQQGIAQISGKVTDEQGAFLPGVSVVVTHEETGAFREVTTSSEGTYVVAQIVPGTYKVSA
ncbi:MAG: carboxypeptidase-like regulatory domain-containing protein, partial [Vicinamibacterales bacterium]